MARAVGLWSGLWLLLQVAAVLAVRFVAADPWRGALVTGPLCGTAAWLAMVGFAGSDRRRNRRSKALWEQMGPPPVPVFPEEPPQAPQPLSGVLGTTPFDLAHREGQTVLRVGDREMVIEPDTHVRHRAHLLWKTFSVAQPHRPAFVLRYHLPWGLQVFARHEPDFFVAQMDDPGLELTAELGGDTGWVSAYVAR
ncbi:hypothetical protein [Streptomyces xantholiticus]|uniref:hypothetical protein n=1 Tax=Streptomyces xantholiticus TaxID=68285 RepID=UPI001677A547|nr:hypothetical protein [Streptomyces xantholiticus]GGW53061.1 hypothetical protein GCM10010381_43080 [Streptomyces xantholiticus]